MTTKKSFRAKTIGSSLEINVPGLSGWKVKLDDIESRLGDMRPVFERYGQYQMDSTLRTHAAQGRPKKWKPLALATQMERARQGFSPSAPILERTGHLKRQYFYDYTKSTYWFDNKASYFKYHQKGGRKIPKRVMIQLLAQDKAQFTRYRNQYIRGEFGL